MLFSRDVPTAPGGLEPGSYVRAKTSPDKWLFHTCCEDMLPGSLPGSFTLCLLVLPSPITREQSAELRAGVGSHCSFRSYSGIFSTKKKPLSPRPPGKQGHETS